MSKYYCENSVVVFVTVYEIETVGLLLNAMLVEVDGKEVVCPKSHPPDSPSTPHTLTDPHTTTGDEDNKVSY